MNEELIVREGLPFPYAHYCGTFVGFHRDLATELTFCECQRDAITNHLAMCEIAASNQKQSRRNSWYVNEYFDFPRSLLRVVGRFASEPHKALMRFISFAPSLCHRCNRMPIYGSYGYSDVPSNYFISHFRPYVNQAFYALGLHPSGQIALPDKCPFSIKEMDGAQRQAHVENQVREAFCFPKIGINRNQESMLFLLTRAILPSCTVVQHYRPEWLEGLELDMYIEEHKIAIEFQGIQHSEPMEHLGGEVALKSARRRDKKKSLLCKTHGVRLIEIHEGRELKDSIVRFALNKVLPEIPLISPQRIAHPPFDFNVDGTGFSSRWTNHHDKGELSISIDGSHGSFYAGGTDYTITVRCFGQDVSGIDVWMQRSSGAASFKLKIQGSGQVVKVSRSELPMMDFFRVWATFDPNIVFVVEKKGAQG